MPKLSPKVYMFLIILVAGMWAISVAISFISYFTGGDYRPDLIVHAAFMGILGVLFGFGGYKSRNNGDGKSNGGGK